MTTAQFQAPPGPSASVVHKMPSSSTIRMDDDEDMSFDSSNDEAAYYRDRYRRVADCLEETRAELDEFQASSKELEDELEKELAATEKQQAELKDRIKRLESEKEEWKTKHVNLQKMHSSTVSAMQREMDNLRSERDKTLVALRDLEMGNDELERNERVAVSSLLDLESKYNRAIEEKTLLEQEVVQKAELDEDMQRLKDELRDANDQIFILRDQLTRSTLPTPPSSVSVPLSPSRSTTGLPDTHPGEISTLTVEPPTSPLHPIDSPTPLPLPKTTISRSSSAHSNLTTSSPTLRRTTTQIPSTTGISRSHTTRNLIGVSGLPVASPSLVRSKSGIPQPSPLRVTERKESRSKAAKLLTDLRSRIKATDDRLGSKVTRRTVSNPISESSKAALHRPVNSRLAALTQDPLHTPQSSGQASSILSPNGWILVDDSTSEFEQTPGGRPEPRSPLDPIPAHQPRAVSGASTATTSRGLPSRPGIPSPLMTLAAARQNQSHGTPTPLSHSSIPLPSSFLAKSTNRPPSRSALAQSTRTAPAPVKDARPPSRSAMTARAPSRSGTGRDRAMSPTSPTFSSYARSGARSPGPNTLQSLSSSVSASSTRIPLPREQTTRPATGIPLGKGPAPPISGKKQLSMSVSVSSPSVTPLRRSSTRRSLGPGQLQPEKGEEGYFDQKIVTTPRGTPGRTPPVGKGRPASVPHFGTPPAEVPRIPSVHLRDKRRTLQQG